METAVTGIISHDLNGIVIGWDAGAEKIFGYSHSEILGSPISLLIPPDLSEEKIEALQRLVRMERVAPFETRRFRKDGQPISVLLAPSPVQDCTGKVVAITKVVCEVTTHQEAAPAPASRLVSSTDGFAPQYDRAFQRDTNPPTFEFPQTGSLPRLANLRALLEVLPNGAMLVDGQGLIVIINTGAVRMFEYRQEELLGWSIECLFPGARSEPRWHDPAQILESPLVLSVEMGSDITAYRKDGSQFPAQITLSSIQALEGTFVLVTVVDITARKQMEKALQESEQKFQLIVDCMPQLVWTSKPDGQCDFLNKQWVEYTGVPAAEHLGLNWLEQIHPDDKAHLIRVWKAAVATGADCHPEFRIRRQDGAYHWFNMHGVPLRDAEARILKWIGSSTDVQEMHELHEALQKSITRLQLLADASHAFTEVSLDYQAMLELLARKTVEALGDNCFIVLFSDDGHLQGPIAVYDVDPERAELVRMAAESVPHTVDGPSLARTVMQSEQPLLIPVVDQEWLRTAVKPAFSLVRDRLNPHSLMVVPIHVQKRIIGLVYLFRCRREWAAFAEEDVKLAQDLANRAALAITNARLYRDAQKELERRRQTEQSLRESEEYFRRLFDEATVPTIIFAPDGHFLKPNSAACRFFGLPEDVLLTYTFRDVTYPEDLTRTEEALAPLLSGAADAYQIEKRFVRPQGEVVWALVNCAVMRDTAGVLSRLIVQLQDITERQRALQAIRMLNAELEQRVKGRTSELTIANKELEAFSYSVSHDLRAPLRNISGFVDLFTKSVGQQLAAGPQRYLTIITNEAKRMGVLIDDLLAFSRIGRVEFHKTAVDLAQLVQEVQASLQLETQGRNIAWHLDDLPTVMGDRALLRQVLVNLIANAIKFTRPRAQARIEIGVLPSLADDPLVVVFVRDNGVGFDMKYSDKLFTVFQRLHRADEFEGTGVGLANVQRIIHRHGGRVWAEAVVDQGATFFVALPNQK